MRDDHQRLLDIAEAMDNIERYVHAESDLHPAAEDELLNVWVIHHLQIIGEAASKLSEGFRTQHPDVAWGSMIGMRHVLVHGYFETNSTIVWKVVQNDLPVLRKQVESILAKMK